MIKSVELAGAAKNSANLLKETMENWKTILICSNADLGAVKNKPRYLASWLIVTITVYSNPPTIKYWLFMDDLKPCVGRQPDIDKLIQTVFTEQMM